MARNTYEKKYTQHAFIISNVDIDANEFYEELPPEAFSNPALKMTVLKCEIDRSPKLGIEEFFSTECFEENYPDFNACYMKALFGGTESWKLSAVEIRNELLSIKFATDRKPVIDETGRIRNNAEVIGFAIGEVSLQFEMDYQDGLPPLRHIVDFVDHDGDDGSQIITITKMIGERKLQKIEMHGDNFGYLLGNGLHCLVTEY